MTTDQDLGGHLEVIANNGKYVVDSDNRIVLSLLKYTGKSWPKILRTKISDHVNINVLARENVR